MNKIILRADGGGQIGLGHIYRLLALSEMLKDSFQCLFVIRPVDQLIQDLIRNFCELYVLEDSTNGSEIEQLLKLLSPKDCLILDGYQFDIDYQLSVKKNHNFLVVIDDLCDKPFAADLIINHGKRGIEKQYQVTAPTKILTGLQYLILRQEFLRVAKRDRTVTSVENIFICFGGSDPYGLTVKGVKASLASALFKTIVVVTGAGYKDVHELANLVSEFPETILHRNNVEAAELSELMQNCQVALSTASTIALELCCVRMGLITTVVVQNQELLYSELQDNGCSVGIKDVYQSTVEELSQIIRKVADPEVVQSLIANQRRVFDGRSGDRISNILKNSITEHAQTNNR